MRSCASAYAIWGIWRKGKCKRAADKDDIAEQVVAFCRTDSITGQTLAIDAGRFFH